MDLPQTLYGQLYLLAYDRHRHRFPHEKLLLLGFALRVLTVSLDDDHGVVIRHWAC